MKLPKPGPDVFNRVSFKNARDTYFGGAGVIIGKGKNARAHMHATLGIQEADAHTMDVVDAVRLARELEVDMVAVNSGRILTFDEGEIQAGYIVDFHGVRLTWMGEMIAEDVFGQMTGPAYIPALIYRLTKWTWKAGKKVHLLREPGGPTWVMQEYCKKVDPELTIDNLDQVGSKLKLPHGWKFETKVLTRDLVLDTTCCDGWASMLRDELQCTYQACGYDSDTSANFVP
ncbi:MAG: hypothetical protein NTU98_05545 [Bacteroidetes bacterium]|nr:hypothetical protein [Bacteroidota bacterium]